MLLTFVGSFPAKTLYVKAGKYFSLTVVVSVVLSDKWKHIDLSSRTVLLLLIDSLLIT